MRKLGAYSPEILREDIPALLDAVRGYGFRELQLSFASVCGEELPQAIPRPLAEMLGRQAAERDIAICCVNGTFNMIHPDPEVRARGVARFRVLAGACLFLGCRTVSLCTGSRNREHMWRWHDENLSDQAWRDLLETMELLLEIAEETGIRLGVEPEASNVVNTPERARLLLDTMKSPRLGIILDPANLFQPGQARPELCRDVLDNAFQLLGDDIILAHGKDILPGEGLAFTAPGKGIVDYRHFLELLDDWGYKGGVVLHGIKEEGDMAPAIAYVRALG